MNNDKGDYPPSDNDPRYVTDSTQVLDDSSGLDQITYPDGAMPYPNDHGNDTYPSGPANRDPLHEDPRRYFVRTELRESDVDELYQTRAIALPANSQPVLILGPNPRRRKITLFTDGNNTGPVFITNNPAANAANSSNAIALGKGSDFFYMKHTGQVFAFSTTDAWLYMYVENYR